MADVAELGIKVDSSPAARAAVDLDKLAIAAKSADGATMNLAVASKTMAGAANVEDAALVKLTATERIAAQVSQAEAAATRIAAVEHQAHGSAVGINRMQMMEFTHSGRAMIDMLAAGMSPMRALTMEAPRLLQAIGSGQGGLIGGFGLLTRMLLPFGAIIGAVAVNVAALTTEINKNQKVQVGWTDVVKASFEVLGDAIKEKTKPAFDWLGSVWDSIAPKFADNIATIIKNFDLAFRNIKTEWSLLPAALGEAAIDATQGILNALADMLNKNRAQTMAYLAATGTALGPIFGGAFTGASSALAILPQFKAPQLDNPFRGSGKDLQAQLAQNYLDVSNTDPLGAIGDRARKDKLAEIAANADKAKKAVKTLGDGFGQLKDETNAFADAAKSAFSNLGSGLINAFQKGGNVAMNVLSMLLDRVTQLSNAMLDKTLNGLINNGINSLFGVTIAQGASIPTGGFIPGLTGPKLFADGGFTGYGGKYEPAGIVHRGEYVFDQASVARIGLGRLNSMRGYADGGYVGAPANNNLGGGLSIHIHNYDGGEVRTEQRQGENGPELHVMLGKMMGDEISKPGSPAYRALNTVHGTRVQQARRA